MSDFDWQPQPGFRYKDRTPWMVDMSNPNNPNPRIWMGNKGDFHPLMGAVGMSPWNTVKGSIDHTVEPPVFSHQHGEGNADGDTAIKHAERHYYQREDNVDDRRVSNWDEWLAPDYNQEFDADAYHKFLWHPHHGIHSWEDEDEGPESGPDFYPSHYDREESLGWIRPMEQSQSVHGIVSVRPNQINIGTHQLKGHNPDQVKADAAEHFKNMYPGRPITWTDGHYYDWFGGNWGQETNNPTHQTERIAGKNTGTSNCIYGCSMPADHWVRMPPDEYNRVGWLAGMCDKHFAMHQQGVAPKVPKSFKKMFKKTVPPPTRQQRPDLWQEGWAPGEPLRLEHEQRKREEWPQWQAKVANDDWAPNMDYDHFWENRRPWTVEPSTGDVWMGEKGEHHDSHPASDEMGGRSGMSNHLALGDIYQGQVNVYDPIDVDLVPLVKKHWETHYGDDPVGGPVPPHFLPKQADADSWSAPSMTNLFEGVGTGESDMNDNKPEHTHPADNWVYINGQVQFGRDHSDTARTLATTLGLAPTDVAYISNLIARNTVPNDKQVAVGTMKGDYPQIWLSTVDRNHVWDEVMRCRQSGQPGSNSNPASREAGTRIAGFPDPPEVIDHDTGPEEQEEGWMHREPYVYDAKNHILHRGDWGAWHSGVENAMYYWYANHGLTAPGVDEKVRGAIQKNPHNPEQIYHTIWNEYGPLERRERQAEMAEGIAKYLGVPVHPHFDPESFHNAERNGYTDWNQFIMDSYEDDDPEDDVWRPRTSAAGDTYTMPSTELGLHTMSDFNHRQPYVYYPQEDVMYWGQPGHVHDDLQSYAQHHMNQIHPQEQDPDGWMYDDHRPRVFGSLYTHPETGQQIHEVHRSQWPNAFRDGGYDSQDITPEGAKVLSDRVGVPVYTQQQVAPDEFMDDIDWDAHLSNTNSPEFDKFFQDANQGVYAPTTKPEYWHPNPQVMDFHNELQSHSGHFDEHIDSSIPGYRDLMNKKGVVITTAFRGASVLDLMGGEGSWGKAISAKGGSPTTTLDANTSMNKFFNEKSQVPGASLESTAFGEPFTDSDGREWPAHVPTAQYDIVNESMGFQFVSSNRAGQIALAKQSLKPGGLMIIDEKMMNDDYDQNESVKDEWKGQFYTPEQLQQKQEIVNVQGEPAEGMMANMAHQDEVERILGGLFRYVKMYWQSGNFFGYLASDSQEPISRFMSAWEGLGEGQVTNGPQNGSQGVLGAHLGGGSPLNYAQEQWERLQGQRMGLEEAANTLTTYLVAQFPNEPENGLRGVAERVVKPSFTAMRRKAAINRMLRGFWPRTSADVSALAAKTREQLLNREDILKLKHTDEGQPLRNELDEEGRPPQGANQMSDWERIRILLTDTPDEGFKLMPWIVREYKRGLKPTMAPGNVEAYPGQADERAGITKQNRRHAQDIIDQAVKWMVWSNEHNKPLPDYMNKGFDFSQLEQWVYDMNSAEGDGSNGWVDSTTVHKFEDGWTIDKVGPNDLAREGELMGHCVGGYCDTVSNGDSTIFSLRDPKGMPHVTIEVKGDVNPTITPMGRDETTFDIVQEQGKQNATPIPEYKDKIEEWYDKLRDDGFEVDMDDQAWYDDPEVDYHPADTVYPNTLAGAREYHQAVMDRDTNLEDDEEGEVQYDNRGRPTVWMYQTPNHMQGRWQGANDLQEMQPIILQAITAANRGVDPRHLAQVLYTTAHHFGSYGREGAALVFFMHAQAEKWKAERRQQDSAHPQQSLFDTGATEFPAVDQLVKWVEAYESTAASTDANNFKPVPGGVQSHHQMNYPHVPGSQMYPNNTLAGRYDWNTKQTGPNWFEQLEQQPHFQMPGPGVTYDMTPPPQGVVGHRHADTVWPWSKDWSWTPWQGEKQEGQSSVWSEKPAERGSREWFDQHNRQMDDISQRLEQTDLAPSDPVEFHAWASKRRNAPYRGARVPQHIQEWGKAQIPQDHWHEGTYVSPYDNPSGAKSWGVIPRNDPKHQWLVSTGMKPHAQANYALPRQLEDGMTVAQWLGLFEGGYTHYDPEQAKKGKLVSLATQRAAHSTDWAYDVRNEPPDCPLCGYQLEIHFEGGASCPRCKSQFELGHDDQVLPSDNTVDEMAKQWPDTLPWGEQGNDYYRNAKLAWSMPGDADLPEDEWDLDNTEVDGRPDRYPWVATKDGQIWFGPEGGSHQMISRKWFGVNTFQQIPDRVAVGELIANDQGYPPYSHTFMGADVHDAVREAWEAGTNRMDGVYRTGNTDDLVAKVRAALTPDLLHPQYRDNPKAHCYVATEALYHLLGGKDSGWTPTRMRTEDGTHWFLKGADGQIVDATADQFDTPPDYSQGRGAGFLTATPSKRTQTVMQRVGAETPNQRLRANEHGWVSKTANTTVYRGSAHVVQPSQVHDPASFMSEWGRGLWTTDLENARYYASHEREYVADTEMEDAPHFYIAQVIYEGTADQGGFEPNPDRSLDDQNNEYLIQQGVTPTKAHVTLVEYADDEDNQDAWGGSYGHAVEVGSTDYTFVNQNGQWVRGA